MLLGFILSGLCRKAWNYEGKKWKKRKKIRKKGNWKSISLSLGLSFSSPFLEVFWGKNSGRVRAELEARIPVLV